MSPSLLPARGIFVPTRIIFDTQLPAAVLVTWIQLRSLAWAGWVTPSLSISELASLAGIHPARLNRHLSQLQDISALTCRKAGNGKIVVTFPEEPTVLPENQAEAQNHSSSPLLNPGNQKLPDHPSYFPNQILGYLSIQEDQEGPFGDEMPDLNLVEAGAMGAEPCEREKGFSYYQNRYSDQVGNLRNQSSRINSHSSHVHP